MCTDKMYTYIKTFAMTYTSSLYYSYVDGHTGTSDYVFNVIR